MDVGVQMKDDAARGKWAIEMQESSVLIGSIIRTTHPELYQQGIEALTILSSEGAKFVDNPD